MFRRNSPGQHLYLTLINASTGAAVIGAAVTATRQIDGGASTALAGTVVDSDSDGQYEIAFDASDLDGDTIGIYLQAAGAVPVGLTIATDAGWDRATAGQYLYFALTDANGDPLTGATVLGTRRLDGAASAVVDGAITEPAADGFYRLALSADDIDGKHCGYYFTAAGASPVSVFLETAEAWTPAQSAFQPSTAPFMADFAQSCTLSGAPVTAIIDTETIESLTGALTMQTSALLTSQDAAGAQPGQAFHDGVNAYVVRQVLQEPPDAQFTRLILARST